MRFTKLVSTVALAGFLAACGDDNGGTATPDASVSGADAGGSATVAINFGPVDDSANQVYSAGDLEWKGNMTYNETSNKVVVSADGWTSNMWATLYDDGPVPTGHEIPGSTAGDHKWSVQVLVDRPVTGMLQGEYGLNDRSYRLRGGDGWLWPPGPNGTFAVSSTSTAVNAPGITIPAFGNVDLRITLDTENLSDPPASDAGPGMWDTSEVGIKSSAWSWGVSEIEVVDGKAVATLSDLVGPGNDWDNSGLRASGDRVEFIWVIGGQEYRDGGPAGRDGVSVEYKEGDGAFMPLTLQGGDMTTGNTFIIIP